MLSAAPGPAVAAASSCPRLAGGTRTTQAGRADGLCRPSGAAVDGQTGEGAGPPAFSTGLGRRQGAAPTASRPPGTARSWLTVALWKPSGASVCHELPSPEVSRATDVPGRPRLGPDLTARHS